VASTSEPVFLGVDLGTTAVKCSLHTLDGTSLGSVAREHVLLTPAPEIVEFSVHRYWLTFAEALHELLGLSGIAAERVIGLGISAQGETLLEVDSDGEPLCNAIVWLDNRARTEAAELDDRFGHELFYEITGQPAMLPAWPAAKILWIARHEPLLFERTKRFLLLEDYFVWRLTGEYTCEGSLATSTCYWDFRRKTWWPEMLDAIGLDVDRLPPLVEPGTAVAPLRAAVANELGLSRMTTVCTGALDQACGAIGVGNTRPGIVSENTGAALAICATLDSPRLDPKMRFPCHYHGIPNTYMFHTFTTGGMALRWFRDEFCESEWAVARERGADVYDVIAEKAAAVPAGSEGLVVLPHLQGAMAPESNPDARGAVVGLTLRHGRGHVARAILEAIAFVVRRNVEVLEELGVEVRSIRALGGGARSRLWKQIEADVTGRPVTTTVEPEAATLGACVLVGVALGTYANVEEAVSTMVRVSEIFEPDAAMGACYDDAYATYRHAYEALCPVFARECGGACA